MAINEVISITVAVLIWGAIFFGVGYWFHKKHNSGIGMLLAIMGIVMLAGPGIILMIGAVALLVGGTANFFMIFM